MSRFNVLYYFNFISGNMFHVHFLLLYFFIRRLSAVQYYFCNVVSTSYYCCCCCCLTGIRTQPSDPTKYDSRNVIYKIRDKTFYSVHLFFFYHLKVKMYVEICNRFTYLHTVWMNLRDRDKEKVEQKTSSIFISCCFGEFLFVLVLSASYFFFFYLFQNFFLLIYLFVHGRRNEKSIFFLSFSFKKL